MAQTISSNVMHFPLAMSRTTIQVESKVEGVFSVSITTKQSYTKTFL